MLDSPSTSLHPSRRSGDKAPTDKLVSGAGARLSVMKDMILFVEVARQRNFSDAARSLDMPLSTLARRISRFERELGVLLVERTTRQQRLTAEGRDYFERCRHIVDDAMTTYESLHNKVHGVSGTIKLKICELSGVFLLDAVKSFVDAHPNLAVEIASQTDGDENECDLSIRVDTPDRHNATARKLGVIPVGLFAAPGYLRHHAEIDTRAQLRDHDIYVPRAFLHHCDPYLQEILSLQRDRGARFSFSDYSSLIVPLIAREAGIAALPLQAAEPFVTGGLLQSVLPSWQPISLPVFAIMKDRRLPARTRALMTFLTKPHHASRFAAASGFVDPHRSLGADEANWQAA